MYVVSGITLIPQTKNMACWYASAQMLIQWKRNAAQMTFAANADPSELSETVRWEVANNGVTNPQVVRLASLLGLRKVLPQTLTLEGLEYLLRMHGPLWTNGKSHIVVISGVDQKLQKLQVHDPWPPNLGKVDWRPYQWYLSGGAASSRDTGLDVEAVFLYHP